jgi:hypothetical protein
MRFQVLIAAGMNRTAFWEKVPCSLNEVYQRFRDAYCHHPDGGSTHLCNISLLQQDYMALYPRRILVIFKSGDITVHLWTECDAIISFQKYNVMKNQFHSNKQADFFLLKQNCYYNMCTLQYMFIYPGKI